MKISQDDIAQALVDVSRDLPENEFATQVDAAIIMLKRSNPGKPLRSFHYVLERMLYRKGEIFMAKLMTPTGDAGAQATAIEKILKDTLKRDIDLEQVAVPSMIGGAVLRVGDERFDMSIPGALAQLQTYLTSSTLPLFDFSSSSHESQ